jgi:hypothetical protein
MAAEIRLESLLTHLSASPACRHEHAGCHRLFERRRHSCYRAWDSAASNQLPSQVDRHRVTGGCRQISRPRSTPCADSAGKDQQGGQPANHRLPCQSQPLRSLRSNNQVGIADAQPVWEGDSAVFVVTRTNVNQATSFKYKTYDGSAKASTPYLSGDYTGATLLSDTFTGESEEVEVEFQGSSPTVTISVATVNNFVREESEYFYAELTEVTQAGRWATTKRGRPRSSMTTR